jgi:hypothetical protein
VDRSPEDIRVALATIEQVLHSLRGEHDPDFGMNLLIQALEDQEAELLASLLDPRAPASSQTHEDVRPVFVERRQLPDRRTARERRISSEAAPTLQRAGRDRRAGTERRRPATARGSDDRAVGSSTPKAQRDSTAIAGKRSREKPPER